MVVTESLRLFPPIFFLGRQAATLTTLEGINIPSDPGLVIVLPTVNYHRDPAVWGDDAEAFRPDRFADGVNKASSGSTHAYMPFGIGPRGCIGQGFALQEAKLVLVTLLQKYSFKISPGYRHSINIGVTITPKYGVPLIVERI
jgi:11-oxo-beta-amyrin 30-oxidase